jgi:hypothetical protein
MAARDRCPTLYAQLHRCYKRRGHEGDHACWMPASDTHRETFTWPRRPHRERAAAHRPVVK